MSYLSFSKTQLNSAVRASQAKRVDITYHAYSFFLIRPENNGFGFFRKGMLNS